MKKVLFLILVLGLLSPIALAQVTDEQKQQLQLLQGQEVPGIMQKLLADNEQINVIIGEQQTLNVVIESNKVVSVGEGALEENTLDVLVTEGALSQLSTTQDIGTTFKELLDNKEIQFKNHINPAKQY